MFSFINSLLALGAIGGAIPVVIHLLNRRRFKTTRWAAMEFLLASLRKNYKRVRMENILLLLLRVLLIVLMAFALARPRISQSGIFQSLGTETRHVVLIVDDSASMGYRTSGSDTCFTQAKAATLRIVQSLGKGDLVSVIAMSDIARPIIGEGTDDLDLVRREVERLDVGSGGTKVADALAAAADIFDASKKPRQEVFIVTDFTRAGWWKKGALSSGLKEKIDRLKEEAEFYIVDVGAEGPDNMAITSFTPQTHLVGTGSEIELKVDVTNFGKTPRIGERVRLLIDNVNQNDPQIINIDSGKTESCVFKYTFSRKGTYLAEVQIEDDRLKIDNSRCLAVEAQDSVPVLLVNGEPASTPSDNETFLLEQALQPQGKEADARQSNVEPTTVTEFGLSGVDFDKYRMVVIANLASLASPEIVNRLESYVRHGGGLVIFLGDRIDRTFYNEQFYKNGEGLLPAQVGAEQGTLDVGKKGIAMEFVKPVDPALDYWNQMLTRTSRAFLFYRYFELKLPEKRDGIDVITQFENGMPAMVKKSFGHGRVVLFASTADTEWNDLPRGGYSVVAQDLLGYMVSGDVERRNLRVHQPWKWSFSPDEPVDEIDIRLPGQGGSQKLHPYLVKSEGTDAPPLREIVFKETDAAGAYELAFRTKDVADARADLFVANVPPEECDLASLSDEELGELLKDAKFSHIKDIDKLAGTVQEAHAGREFSRALLLAVLAFTCVELVLGQRFGRG